MALWRCTGDDATLIRPSDCPIVESSHSCIGASEHGGSSNRTDGQGNVMLAEPKVQTKRPPLYKVILLNDDYTPMDFVVTVLKQVFRRSHHDALNVMLEVHRSGAGLAGVYTRDIAETKVEQVVDYARISDYPLQCTLEPE